MSRARDLADSADLSFDSGTLVIDSDNDRVGVGTASPIRTLHVDSSSNLVGRFSSSATEGFIQLAGSGTGTAPRVGATGNSFIVYTNDAERMRIGSSGNVGIGTDNPAQSLHIKGNNTTAGYQSPGLTIEQDGTGDATINFLLSGTKRYLLGVDNSDSDKLKIFSDDNGDFTGSGITLDTSGNLLVGTTSDTIGDNTGVNTNGSNIFSDGTAVFGKNGNRPLILNRGTNDGDIVQLKKDGATVGSIASVPAGMAFYATGVNNCGWHLADNSAMLPMKNSALSDNLVDLGSVSYRFDDIYATNGTIQTSDRNEKQDIEELTEAEQRVAVAAKGLLRKFRWIDSVEEKGDDARIHFGIIAQDLQAAFEAEGLDAGRYAMFIHSTWTDEETGEERSRMGVRYSELLAFIIAAI